MHKKIYVVALSLGMFAPLCAMKSSSSSSSLEEVVEEKPLLQSSADALRELDQTYSVNACVALKKRYENFVEEKSKQQKIQWPEQIDGYDVTALSLSNQRLQTIVVDLPSYIKGSCITTLDVSQNQLEDLPLWRIMKTCPNIVDLDASHNAISYVEKSGSGILKKLKLSNNNLEDIDLGNILHAFSGIKTVDLSSNPLKTVTWSSKVVFGEDHEKYPEIDLRKTLLSDDAKNIIKKVYVAGVDAYGINLFDFASISILAITGGMGVVVVAPAYVAKEVISRTYYSWYGEQKALETHADLLDSKLLFDVPTE